jgi:putative acetyltransferase
VSKDNIIIREIREEDNVQMAQVIRSVLEDFGVPKVGTAYADVSLDVMNQTYNKEKAIYFVVDDNGKIIGGAGIAQLDNYDGNVCELQKMYFLPEARGKGLGMRIMERCLEKAKAFGFEQCYLETLPYMKAATKLYAKAGFESLKQPLGDTGHYSCNVWMLKKL